MADPMKNANEIRGVLDGGRLQFRSGGKWIDAGGDADTWLVLLVCADTRDGAYRIKPDGVLAPVAHRAAAATLERLGYTYQDGAELWKPPLGVTLPLEGEREA